MQTASWEINIQKKDTYFLLVVPEEWSIVVKKQINTVWPRATIKEINDPLKHIKPNVVGVLELKEHYMFSLNSKESPIDAVLETIRMMDDTDRAYIQIIIEPAAPDWWENAASGYDSLKQGKMPKRVRLDPQGISKYFLRYMAGATFETISIVQELFGFKNEGFDIHEIDRARLLREGHSSSRPSLSKIKEDAFEVTIRIAVQAEKSKAPTLLRALGVAYRELDGDNALIMRTLEGKNVINTMKKRKTGLKINHDYLSVSELSSIIQLPTKHLQEKYNIDAVAQRESRLPTIVTRGGMLIGESIYKGNKTPVYKPVKNEDELCLPTCVIGQMGSGKTTFGANIAVEAVKNGFSAVVIDPARGEIGDEVEKALSPEQVCRFTFGKTVIALDWREVLHSNRSKNRLANEMVAFFDAATDEAGVQTLRYLRSAAKAVPSGSLRDIIGLMTNQDVRQRLLEHMSPSEKAIWIDYDTNMSPARQAQISAPVLNRLDVITGDDYLNDCIEETDNGIDFIELLDGEPKAIIIDIMKEDLGAEGVDILASLIATKLNVAMLLRKSKRPTFIVQDEPHQYMRSARVWRSVSVESRKYRFAYVWLFHAWEQIPRELSAIIQNAGPHYHLYASSKSTYRALAEEIKPFDVEEAMRTPRHHAINIIRAGGNIVTPFMAKMLPPPSKRL